MSGPGENSDWPGIKAPSTIERAAAQWVFRREQGLSAAEETAFSAWLDENPDHPKIFSEMEETSHLLDGFRRSCGQTPQAFLAEPIPTRRPTRFWPLAVAVAAVIAAIFLASGHLTRESPSFVQSFLTEVGGLRTLDLPDGSTVQLNTNTAIEVSYRKSEREVKLLRGEAYFTVAKNPQRPFWVDAGPTSVRAVGTAFNVRIRADSVSVLVTDGKVQVVAAENRSLSPERELKNLVPVLSVGQLAKVTMGEGNARAVAKVNVSSIEQRAVESTLAWQHGRLEFFETPLGEVVAEFNRYNLHKIAIEDPALASRRFGGAFASHEIEPLLELLEQSFGVVSEVRDGTTVIRLARNQAPPAAR